MGLSQYTIDAVKERIEIEDVVSDFLTLKKKGQNLWACCPFHDEKTPSFSVAPSKGIYKCFGCGKAGDGITFVMEHEGVTYPEAIVYLAKKYGVEVVEENLSGQAQEAQNERESLFILMGFAQKYFTECLFEHEEGKTIGLTYLKERGFNEEIIRKFGLGYSLNAWDNLLKEAKRSGYSEELLEKTGLVVRKDERVYDRFRGRIIFPIQNLTGKTIAFGARRIKNNDNSPKYVNSPETELYHKSNVLYGIAQAKKAIRANNNVYLTEGYTDVLAIHHAGIQEVVASSGTSLTDDQIKLLKRFTSNITVLFDGDAAGLMASLRGIDMILEKDLNVKVVIFPDGEDPDSYSKKIGPSDFKHYLNSNAVDFIQFKTRLLAKESSNDPFKKAETIKDIVKSIVKIPDPLKRSIYTKETSEILQIDESVLLAEQNKILFEGKRKSSNSTVAIIEDSPEKEETKKEKPSVQRVNFQERECIRLLISYGLNKIEEDYHLYHYILDEIKDISFETPVYQRILALFKENLAHGKVIDAQYFIENGTEDIKQEVIDLITEKYEFSKNWEDSFQIIIPKEEQILKDVVYTGILRLKHQIVKKLIAGNLNELKQAGDEPTQLKHQRIHQSLKDTEVQIASALGNVTP